MPEDARPESPVSLARQLIARREYDQAIELVRSQMRGRAPTPLMRLQLADVLVAAGRGSEAVPVLLAVADDLAADGFLARAIAVLKRVEAVAPDRHDVSVRLSSLVERQHRLAAAGGRERDAGGAAAAPPSPEPDPSAEPGEAASSEPAPERHGLAGRVRTVFRKFLASLSGGAAAEAPADDLAEPATSPPDASRAAFEERVLDAVQEYVRPAQPPPAAAVSWDERMAALDRARRLVAIPLFADLTEEELLAVVRGLQLLVFEPGQIVITEGQSGQSVFVITAGAVKVFVRNPSGHDVEVGELHEGDFFGEISSLSGRPRTATVTAAARCELLELDKATVDAIAHTHERVREMLDAAYVERVSSPEALAARQVAWSEGTARARALDVLQESFGEAHWTPRTRLRLADALYKSGRQEAVVDVLLDCVDELTREGFPGKAVALLKKIERLQRRHIEEVNLAPMLKVEGSAPAYGPAAAGASAAPPAGPEIEEHFEDWLLAMARQVAARRSPEPRPLPGTGGGALDGYLGGLRASPLLESLSDDELTDVVEAFALVRCAAGQVILTEGEPGQSVFVLAGGGVRVFVRDAGGRNVEVAQLAEGSFFGEMAALSSRPRSATVTAAAACELLELDRPALDRLCAAHPRVRETLEEFSIARAGSPKVKAARAAAAPGGEPPPAK